MLSEKDYKDYLMQIGKVENTMANAYQDIIDRVEDEEIRRICGNLLKAEKIHASIVLEMMKLMVL